MNTKQPTPKESIQAENFDTCVAELSEPAQAFFDLMVRELAAGLANGGGEKSAKAIMWATALQGNMFRKFTPAADGRGE
jgi:hypothetical protein